MSTTSRRLAAIRSRFPLLFLLIGVLFGQCAALEWRLLAATAACSIAVDLLRRSGLSLALTAGMVVGAVSMRIAAPSFDLRALNGERHLLGSIAGLRYPQIGGVELLLELRAVRGTGQGESWFELPAPLFVRCRAVQLPWRKIYGATESADVIVRANLRALRRDPPFSYEARELRRGVSGHCRIRHALLISSGAMGLFSRTREYLQHAVRDRLGDTEAAGLFLSMVFGVRDQLAEPTERAFRESGLSHLLVASGYQVTLIFMAAGGGFAMIFSVMPRPLHLPLARWLAAAAGVAAALFYVALVGFEGPVLRAGVGALFVVISGMTERGGGMGNSVIVSLLLLSVLWPGIWLEPGTQLTYAALIGIAAAQDPDEAGLMRYIRSTVTASLCTGIVGLLWFGAFSFWSVPLNLLLGQIVSAVSCNGGLLALAAAESGLDSGSYMLRGVVVLQSAFRDLLMAVTAVEWGYVELNGLSSVIMAAGIGCLTLAALPHSRVKQFACRQDR